MCTGGVGDQVGGIDHHHALRAGKPDPAVGGLADGTEFNLGGVNCLHRFEPVVGDTVDARDLAFGKGVQVLAADAENAAAGIHPESALVVADAGVDGVVEQAVVAADLADLFVLDPSHRSAQPRPDNSVPVFVKPEDVLAGKGALHRPAPADAVLQLEDTVDRGDEDGTVAAAEHAAHPVERGWGFPIVSYRPQFTAADPEQFAADRRDHALRILGQGGRPVRVRVARDDFSPRQHLDLPAAVDEVNVTVPGFENAFDVRRGHPGIRVVVSHLLAVEPGESLAGGRPDAALRRGADCMAHVPRQALGPGVNGKFHVGQQAQPIAGADPKAALLILAERHDRVVHQPVRLPEG